MNNIHIENKLFSRGIKYIAGVDEVGRGPLAGPMVVSAVVLDVSKILSLYYKLKDTSEHKSNSKIKKLRDKYLKVEDYSAEKTDLRYKLKDDVIFFNQNIDLKAKNTNKQLIINNSMTNSEDDIITNNDIELIKCYGSITDSKKIAENKRNKLSEFIKNNCITYSIYKIDSKEIDAKGIGQVNKMAFFNAISKLSIKPQHIITDAFNISTVPQDQQSNVIKGDLKSISVAAASILAKVYRDNLMIELSKIYKEYGFEKHKGYGTKLHIEKINKLGPCEIHRKSFAPIKNM